MRAVIQRVKQARVLIDSSTFSSIGNGLLVLLGVEGEDMEEDVSWLSVKVANLRIIGDAGGKMNRSIKETGGEVLVVSQFTLFADTKKGNRPSFTRSAKREKANFFYEMFNKLLSEELGRNVQTGKFGAMMEIELINDGPVTIILDSRRKEI